LPIGKRGAGSSTPQSPTPQASERKADKPHGRRVAVYDGHDWIGSVEIVDGGFIAISITGKVVGTFETLSTATRSLPVQGGAS
jgi:hypothetical protein